MRIDFRELPADGNDFELLVRELLYSKGLEVYWSGKGADGGKDLLCVEKQPSCVKGSSRRWLVQCKHNAHSGRAVGPADLESIVDACAEHNASGYLLACSTYPSSALVRRLEEIENSKGILTQFWDFRTLERELLQPENWGTASMFFPRSLSACGWTISAIEPGFWHASYQDNIFYLSTRISADANLRLPEIERRIRSLRALSLPEGHLLRLRAVHFDEKHGEFTMYLDYLIPQREEIDEMYLEVTTSELEHLTTLDGIPYCFDVMPYHYFYGSDHFDRDHIDYYKGFLEVFRLGGSRKGLRRYVYAHGHSSRELTEKNRNEAFEALTRAFRRLPFLRVLSAVNAKIEFIDQFSGNFTWGSQFSAADYHIDNFFDARIRFTCPDFALLTRLLESVPNDVSNYFQLSKIYVFMPEEGLDREEDDIYTLHFSIHPAGVTSKYQFRRALNQYLEEVREAVEVFLELSGGSEEL